MSSSLPGLWWAYRAPWGLVENSSYKQGDIWLFTFCKMFFRVFHELIVFWGMLGNECSVHVGRHHNSLVWTSMLSLTVGVHSVYIWSGSASSVSSKRNLCIVPDPLPSLHQDVVSEEYQGIHLRSINTLLFQTECWGQPAFLMPSLPEEARPWAVVAILCHRVAQNIWNGRQLNSKSPLAP